MALPPILRRVLAIVAALLLLVLAWLGISGGVQQWPQSNTAGQRLQTAAQVVYGVFAIVSLVTAFTWRQWQPLANAIFVAGTIAAATLATRVWGGGTLTATAISGLAALVISGVLVWMLRTGATATLPRQADDPT